MSSVRSSDVHEVFAAIASESRGAQVALRVQQDAWASPHTKFREQGLSLQNRTLW